MKVPVIIIATLLATQAEAKNFSMLGAMDADGTVSSVTSVPQTRVTGPFREEISFASSLPPGSVLVRTHERKLYFIKADGMAIAYTVAVGREGFAWHGTNSITRKKEWPDWTAPPQMVAREEAHGHIIPVFIRGGERNPLGARALYIGDTDYRIHGTDQPGMIGYASSSGCIRMRNEDVIELYGLVQIGAKVVVE